MNGRTGHDTRLSSTRYTPFICLGDSCLSVPCEKASLSNRREIRISRSGADGTDPEKERTVNDERSTSTLPYVEGPAHVVFASFALKLCRDVPEVWVQCLQSVSRPPSRDVFDCLVLAEWLSSLGSV